MAMDSVDLSKYSIMSQLGPDTSFALRKSIDDILANGESLSDLRQPKVITTAQNTDMSNPATRSGTHADANISKVVENEQGDGRSKLRWTRNGYPRTSQHRNSSDLESESGPRPVNGADVEQTGHEWPEHEHKQLRRSPGNDQLRGIMPVSEQSLNTTPRATSSPEVEAEQFSGHVPLSAQRPALSTGIASWRRGAYPLQLQQNVQVSAMSHERFSRNELNPAKNSILNHFQSSDETASTLQHELPKRPASSISARSAAIKPASHHSPLIDPNDAVDPRFRNGLYPLQQRAVDLERRSETQDSSSEDSDGQQSNLLSLEGCVPSKGRQKYPLQSSASVLSLRKPPTPPSSSDDEDVRSNTNGGMVSAASVTAQGSPAAKVLRSVYPMQPMPSVVNLRTNSKLDGTITDDNTVRLNHATPAKPGAGSRQSSASAHSSRRSYPIQHLPSMADLQGTSIVGTAEPKPSEGGRVQRKRTSTSTSKVGRASYPIQHLPSIADLQAVPGSSNESGAHLGVAGGISPTDDYHSNPAVHSASQLPDLNLVPPSPSEHDDFEKKMQERNLTAKTLRQWRRQICPLQGGDVQRLGQEDRAQDSVEHAPRARSPSPGPIHLPKNMRAVTNAEDAQNGSRTIIVCLDGTGDKFDDDNSNIVQLVSSLKKDDPRQVTYYQAGIGTYNKGGLNTGFSAAMDMAVGSELGLHVRDAYQFLMHSYKEGDKICIFGFSRGAYTARCLAGMVHKVGLLPPRNLQQIAFAYEFYSDTTPRGWHESRLFKATFSIDVSVYFLGCFDSVASVGLIPRQLPLSSTATNKCRYFRHAMALDERRAKFKVCRFEAKDLDDDGIEDGSSQNKKHQDREVLDQPHRPDRLPYGPLYHPNVTNDEYERLVEPEAVIETDVSEVWFAGAHADVGGGAVSNTTRHKLAQIPLRWMIRQAFECNTGILFKTKKLAEFGLDVHTLWPRYHRLEVPSLHGPPPSYLEKYDPHTTGLPPRSVRGAKLVPTEKLDETTSSSSVATAAAATATGDAHSLLSKEPLYHLKSHKDEDWTPEQVEDFYDALAPLNDQLIDAPNWWLLEAWPVQYKVPVGNGQVQIRVGPNWGRYRGVGDREPSMHWTVRQREEVLGGYRVRVRTAPFTRWRVVV